MPTLNELEVTCLDPDVSVEAKRHRVPQATQTYTFPRAISNDIIMEEAADHSSTPAAGFGYLWTKNTSPSTLIFTNDDGTDLTLATGGGDLLADGTVPLTADWDVGAFDITAVDVNADLIQLDLAAAVTVSQGQFAWNADEETADLGLNGAVLQLGQETHYHARNATGSLIADGKPVMATGTIGASGRITIGLMDGSNIANAKFFLGITTEAIADTTDGKVTAFGKVRGIKTDYATWAEGDVLWVDNDNVGELTNVQPTSGSRLPIAFIVSVHATNGTIAVRATDGTYLAEAHDTAIASPADGEVLQHNGTAWENTYAFERRDIAFTDETSDLTTGDNKATFHMPNYATTLLEVSVGVTTAPTGTAAIFDLEEGGTTVLSTLITIDAGEKTSEDAGTPPVISDSALAANALMTVNIDQIGSGVAGAGAKLYVKYKRA